ncbi:MAG: hypothetical protein F6J90_12160 [Moorea sp. SIOASIH]|uniref:hypothetical protein n=1 Tax=Moorena sp. SIOASIH TaxID=2607817 RepID=UPI0013BB7C93|nr:hypothetical protein [Moorena sp. SIOASIH]NEO37024.1 hypothetical protein [Moorena sp. SIOASIH]
MKESKHSAVSCQQSALSSQRSAVSYLALNLYGLFLLSNKTPDLFCLLPLASCLFRQSMN